MNLITYVLVFSKRILMDQNGALGSYFLTRLSHKLKNLLFLNYIFIIGQSSKF